MKTRFWLLCLIICFYLSSTGGAVANQPFPDTGQTKCYDNTSEIPCPLPGQPFYGQEAQYQPRLYRFYTKLGHGDVILPDDAAHVDDGGPWIMTQDNVTGLIWEIKTNVNMNDRYLWSSRMDHIHDLNRSGFGGFSNWHLPNRQELASLLSLQNYNPAIESKWFPNTFIGFYWTDTLYKGRYKGAWVVSFNGGFVFEIYVDGGGWPAAQLPVRAVRYRQ